MEPPVVLVQHEADADCKNLGQCQDDDCAREGEGPAGDKGFDA